jgi:hypothetical protein
MSWIFRLNGYTDAELGVYASRDGSPWSPAPLSRAREGRAAGMGARPDPIAVGASRLMPTRVVLRADVDNRRAKLDRLLSLSHGLLELEWSDAPDRVWLVRIDRMQVEAAHPGANSWNNPIAIDLNFEEDEGVAWDREPMVIRLEAGVPVPCPMGTAPSVPVFRFPGAFSTLSVQLLRPSGEPFRDRDGTTRRQYVLAGTVEAGEYVELDGGTFGSPEVILGSDGSRVTAGHLTVNGSHDPFVLDPTFGDPGRGRWPLVLASEDGVLEYIRTWR